MSKTYVTIGGSSGIGLKTVQILTEKGHKVINYSRTNEELSNIDGVEHHQLDITSDFSELEGLPESVDGLAYFPGTINLKPFKRLKGEDFIHEFNVNLIGAVKVLQAAEGALRKSGNASVVMFSTVAVGRGMPFHASIAASKGAVEGFVRSLASEYAPTVRFNAIAPSVTDTPLAKRILGNEQRKQNSAETHPLKRVGEPEDIANATAFLLSEESSWITGQIIGIDGGLSTLK